MPELAEVETSRRAVDKALRGHRIARVLPDADDRITYDRATPAQFRKALEGAKVLGSGRRGKYFWLELDRRPWPVFHLGMTGNVEIRRAGGEFAKAWGDRKHQGHASATPKRASKKPAAAPPKMLLYCRLRIALADGTEVAITDPRRFGRIRLARDPESEPPISRLGPDPLVDFPSAKALHATLARRKAPIKALLLDQALFAGVGNWIADEALFQARLSPHRAGTSLAPGDVARLRAKLLSVIRKAVDVRADYHRFPRTWLFHTRWGKVEGAATSTKHAIKHDTVGGRTSAWVPELQK